MKVREATLEINFQYPDYLTTSEVYAAVDAAAITFELSHVEVLNMALYGVDPDVEEQENDNNG